MSALSEPIQDRVFHLLNEVSSEDVVARLSPEADGFLELNLREIGLDSLSLLEFAIEVEKSLNLSLDLRQLNVTPESTVGELLRLVTAHAHSE